MLAGYQLRSKEELWRVAWINAEQYNSSGMLERGKRVKPEDFLVFDKPTNEEIKVPEDFVDTWVPDPARLDPNMFPKKESSSGDSLDPTKQLNQEENPVGCNLKPPWVDDDVK